MPNQTPENERPVSAAEFSEWLQNQPIVGSFDDFATYVGAEEARYGRYVDTGATMRWEVATNDHPDTAELRKIKELILINAQSGLLGNRVQRAIHQNRDEPSVQRLVTILLECVSMDVVEHTPIQTAQPGEAVYGIDWRPLPGQFGSWTREQMAAVPPAPTPAPPQPESESQLSWK